MNKRKRKRSVFEWIVILCACLVTLFVLTALAFILVKGIPNLKEVVTSQEVRFAVWLSLWTSLLSTSICLLLGVPTAYAFTRTDMRLRRVCIVIVELPLSVPNLMIGLSLLLMFSSMPGKYLSSHGIRFIFDVKGIVLAQLMVNMPFLLRIARTSFMEMDPRLETIAESLGAGRMQTFFQIILPMAKNGILGGAVVAWSRALGEFGATLMFVGATRLKTETIPTSIYLNMATGDTGPAMACAMIILIISAVTLVLSGFFNQRPGSEKESRR